MNNKTLVFIGAHYDDIELSCSGLINDLKDHNKIIFIIAATRNSNIKENLIRKIEQKKSLKFLKINQVFYLNFKDGFLKENKKIFNKIEQILKKIKPDYCFTHFYNDTHQDHKCLSNIVKSICLKNNFNLCFFESFSTYNMNYNLVYSIDLNKKIKNLLVFKSQINKKYNDKLTFLEKQIEKNKFYGKMHNNNASEIYYIYKINFKKGKNR